MSHSPRTHCCAIKRPLRTITLFEGDSTVSELSTDDVDRSEGELGTSVGVGISMMTDALMVEV